MYEPTHPLARKDGYVQEHRKVAWDAGLLTDPRMHVHHRNGEKADNRLENLAVMDAGDHHRLHVGSIIVNQYGTFPVSDLDAGERQCRDCGAYKPFCEFPMLAGRPDSYCKACRVDRVRRYRQSGSSRREP